MGNLNENFIGDQDLSAFFNLSSYYSTLRLNKSWFGFFNSCESDLAAQSFELTKAD